MKTFVHRRFANCQTAIWTALLIFTATVSGQTTNYATCKAAAEKFYAEGSYAKAHELYAQLRLLSSISHEEARWVAFRFADTQWRSAAATDNPDTTKLDEARESLEKQIRDLTRQDQHDRIWVEVEESLGDFFLDAAPPFRLVQQLEPCLAALPGRTGLVGRTKRFGFGAQTLFEHRLAHFAGADRFRSGIVLAYQLDNNIFSLAIK